MVEQTSRRIFHIWGTTALRLTKTDLISLRTRSLRRRVWYRCLTDLERSLVNLTVRVVEEVRSLQLSRLLWAIASRLGEALENHFLKRVWERGRELALRLSGTAHSWGNGSALDWAEDRAYVFHLGVCQVNAGSMLGRSL